MIFEVAFQEQKALIDISVLDKQERFKSLFSSNMLLLNAKFKESNQRTHVQCTDVSDDILVKFDDLYVMHDSETEPYEGPYTVTPKVQSQILETKNRYLDKNVSVLEIPYAAVSNPSGGLTITIGGQ